jgi:hypothetical protein
MTVKSQHVIRSAKAEVAPPTRVGVKRMRGFAGNQALVRKQGATENAERRADERLQIDGVANSDQKAPLRVELTRRGQIRKEIFASPDTGRKPTAGVPPIVHAVLRSPGQPLDAATSAFFEPRFRHDFSRVRVHTDGVAQASTRAVNAIAYTVGRQIVFGRGHHSVTNIEGQALLAHELAHVVQQEKAAPVGSEDLEQNTTFEGDANRVAESVMSGERSPLMVNARTQGLMRSIAQVILARAGRWLTGRAIKTVSKHIAKHARNIAGKAIHSVFKSPKNIKSMLQGAVKEAAELAARHPKIPVTHVLEEGGLKIARQSTGSPGKFRWVVQKTFGKAIGTKGEKILRIIIDQSGRIVTAFPTDRLIALGISIGAIELLSERTAEAGTTVRKMAEAEAAREDERSGLDWEDFIPYIGAIWGGSLNEGESEWLRQRDFIEKVIADAIAEVELTEKRSLGPQERQEVEDLVRVGIATPLFGEGELESD